MPRTPIHMPTASDRIVPVQRPQQDQPSGRVKPATFLATISVALGILVTVGLILGGLGRAYFVDRGEYNAQMLKDTARQSDVNGALDRLTHTLVRQEAAFEKLSQAVQVIQIEMAKHRP